MRIAFLGLGHMGMPMARNLLGLGHTVTVYNRTPNRVKDLLALGAKEAATVAEAVKNAEVAITMLSDDAAVTTVVYESGGLLQHLPPKAIHLCMSTIGVETSAKLATAHAQAGQGYVAAPIFGRVGAVATRRIWIMAGGPESQVNRCLPIFVALGRGLTRVGPKAALAHALKLGGNVLTAALEKALSEIAASCEKAGMVPADYLRLLNLEIFKSPLVDDFGGVMVQPSVDPEDLSLDHVAKETLLDLQASKGLGETVLVVNKRKARVQAAGARSWREQDFKAQAPASPAAAGLEETAAPECKAPQSIPPVSRPTQSISRPAPPVSRVVPPPAPEPEPEPEPVIDPEATILPQEAQPQPAPPRAAEGAQPKPDANPATSIDRAAVSPRMDPPNTFTALDGPNRVTLDLNQTSHFEVIEGCVWAWSQEKRYETSWHTLSEVELAFRQVMFLLIQRHILLRPEATLSLRGTFGGRAKARVGENMELNVKRTAAPRLKELLGI